MSELAERLRADLELRRDGVSIVVDGLLRRRVKDFVDVAVLVDVVEKGLGEAFVARLFAEHVVPASARLIALLEERDDSKVGDRLPPEEKAALETQVATMDLPQFKWLSGAVDPALMKELFAPIWQDVFSSFMKRFGAVGEGALGLGSSIAGALSRVGGAAMKGLRSDKDKDVSEGGSEFAAGATEKVKELLLARLRSDEGQRISETMRRQIFQRIVETEGAVILEDLERMPIELLLRIAAPIAAYNASSAFGRALVRQELEAILAIEGERSVEDLLTEAGTLPDVRAYLRVVGEGALDALLEDDAFIQWMARWTAG